MKRYNKIHSFTGKIFVVNKRDCGIRFSIKGHMENSRNRDTIERDEN